MKSYTDYLTIRQTAKRGIITEYLAHEPDFPFDVLHVHFVISFLFVQEARRRVALSIYALCNLNLPYPVPLLCGALVSAFAYSVRLRAGLCFPVVIIVYYMGSYISIDKSNKYEPIDLSKMHMDTYIDL